MTYPVDRFFAAVSVLAADGHIKQRLIRAYQDYLADLDDDDLPGTVREAFTELRQQMVRVAPLNGEGPIRASVRKMSASEASDCALAILNLYSHIAPLKSAANQLLPMVGNDDAQVPPFLVKSLS